MNAKSFEEIGTAETEFAVGFGFHGHSSRGGEMGRAGAYTDQWSHQYSYYIIHTCSVAVRGVG